MASALSRTSHHNNSIDKLLKQTHTAKTKNTSYRLGDLNVKNIPPQQLRSSSSLSGGDETVIHVPVLLEDAVRLLAPQKGQTYLDLTAGYGGHASRIIDVVGAHNATLVDRDARAIAHLQPYQAAGARLIHRDFASAAQQLADDGQAYDMVLVDLGVSSPQLDMAEQLVRSRVCFDMRMDESGTRTAADIINHSSEKELMRLIEEYGEEPRATAARIATQYV